MVGHRPGLQKLSCGWVMDLLTLPDTTLGSALALVSGARCCSAGRRCPAEVHHLSGGCNPGLQALGRSSLSWSEPLCVSLSGVCRAKPGPPSSPHGSVAAGEQSPEVGLERNAQLCLRPVPRSMCWRGRIFQQASHACLMCFKLISIAV